MTEREDDDRRKESELSPITDEQIRRDKTYMAAAPKRTDIARSYVLKYIARIETETRLRRDWEASARAYEQDLTRCSKRLEAATKRADEAEGEVSKLEAFVNGKNERIAELEQVRDKLLAGSRGRRERIAALEAENRGFKAKAKDDAVRVAALEQRLARMRHYDPKLFNQLDRLSASADERGSGGTRA